jgi:Na+-transporting methylmalonyl-CoA/oxaloacetate decarboxylase gamma subunit
MTPLVEGLRVSLIGLVLVFAALGVLILVLYLLRWISNLLLESHARKSELATAGPGTGQTADREQEELGRVAVVAVALLRARSSGARDQSLGDLLQEPTSDWWVVRHHGSRVVVREREA